jgi:small subunit ribosomal protein S10
MLKEKNNKLKIDLRGYDVASLEEATRMIAEKVSQLGLDFSLTIPSTKRKVITVLISPHKHKDSQEQFERRTHRRNIHISEISQRNLETLSKLKIPNTVALKLKSFF